MVYGCRNAPTHSTPSTQLSITHGTHILEVYTSITVTTGWDAVDDRLELRSHCIWDVIIFLSASYDTTLFLLGKSEIEVSVSVKGAKTWTVDFEIAPNVIIITFANTTIAFFSYRYSQSRDFQTGSTVASYATRLGQRPSM
jgi:hypothetical protein